MSFFKLRIHENLYVIVDQLDDGRLRVLVVDAQSNEVTNERERVRALVAAVREESRRRTALWEALPEEARHAIREGRA